MPPTTRFDKEQIVEAAFEIAREHGISGVSARGVARRLGCSVAPIYANFDTIDDLISAVVQRVFAMSNALMAEQTGPHPFENMGRASLAFARGYPALFRELALEPNPYMASYDQVEALMLGVMAEEPELAGWSDDERKRLFLKMRIFQLGLSAMVANGHLPQWIGDETAVEELLLETGEEIATAMQDKRKDELL